jgi:holo-[acyl-carrier protein] synthase
MILGTGIDIIEVARIEGILRRQGMKFQQRVYTQREQREIAQRSARAGTGVSPAVRRAAAKFAAKEALLKALGTGLARGIRWTDVEILSKETGAPCIQLTGRARQVAGDLGVVRIHVSLSDSAANAAAAVILEGD